MIDPNSLIDEPMVIVTPKGNDDFSNEFVGEFVGMHGEFYTVRDGDGNCFDVELDQLEKFPDDDYSE